MLQNSSFAIPFVTIDQNGKSRELARRRAIIRLFAVGLRTERMQELEVPDIDR